MITCQIQELSHAGPMPKKRPQFRGLLPSLMHFCSGIDSGARTSSRLGNSGTGKSHIGLGLGPCSLPEGFVGRVTTAAALVHELIEARDEKRGSPHVYYWQLYRKRSKFGKASYDHGTM